MPDTWGSCDTRARHAFTTIDLPHVMGPTGCVYCGTGLGIALAYPHPRHDTEPDTIHPWKDPT